MTDRKESLVGQRLAKLESLRRRGLDPYPHRYHRTHTTQEAVALFKRHEDAGSQDQATVSIAGRIVGSRPMGKATFLDVRDGSGKIQVHLRRDHLGEAKYGEAKDLDLGDIIGVKGRLFRTRTGEVTVGVEDFVILCKALQAPPEKWHGLTDVEKRYRQRYLDLISSQEVRSIFAVRGRVIAAIRRFLDGRGFVEVETPILQPVASGAMARPFVTHHQALDQDLYLRIATELHLKRLIVGGYDKVYELGRVFRNEGISTRHNPEFTTLESYEAYADYSDVMEMTEQMVSTIAQEVLGKKTITYAGQEIDLTPPWRRITLRQAIKERCGIDFEECRDEGSLCAAMAARGVPTADVRGWGKLVDKLLSIFVEPTLIQPTFVMDYPVELSPLAKRKPGSEYLVERFEGFIGGMEVANAFTELNDPVEQRQRFAQQEGLRQALGDEEAERLDEDFITALEYGMPPTGGLGVGVDRLVMLLTDQQSIREVIFFPQLRTK